MTASTVPEPARRRATSGISNAPGTQCTDTSPASIPLSSRRAIAPSSSGLVTWSLKRPATTATRTPRPSSTSPDSAYSPTPSASSELLVLELEQVAHLLLLGPQVRDVLTRRSHVQRDALRDLEAEPVEPAVLGRVVRHELHGRDAEVDQDLRTDAVLARVGREPELDVGLDGVATLVLQRVRPQLVPEPDAPPLVTPQVQNDSASLASDAFEGE